MEKKTRRSGAPFVTAGLAVLAYALLLGIGSLFSYGIAAAVGALGFAAGRKIFPVREIMVERAPDSGDAEVNAVIVEARGKLDAIERANDAIAEEALSAQIDDIASTCRQILAGLEAQPNMLSALRTFLRYYLPATLKLLEERAGIEREIGEGKNAQIAQRIREAMAQVQSAFHKQLDALGEYRFINLESEMDVLSDMLRSDGLLAGDERAEAAERAQGDPFAALFEQEGK